MLKLKPVLKNYLWDGKKFYSMYGRGNNGEQTLIECKYFCCRKLELNGKYIEQNENSFTTVNIIDGQGEINCREFKKGDSFFIDCGKCYEINGKAMIMLSSKS